MSNDIYQRVTDRIIAAIETGAGSWRKPWIATRAMPRNAVTGREYRGVNVLTLAMSGYSSGRYATFRQWLEAGACVRKGEKSAATVVYASRVEKKAKAGDEEPGSYFLCKEAHVFAEEQVTALEGSSWAPAPVSVRSEPEAFAAAEEIASRSRATVNWGRDAAFYAPELDYIGMPARASFQSQHGLYSTLFHELGHWTGHKSRLARDLANRFGSEAYAAEELVAELTAAFLCCRCGLTQEPRADHAQYLASWLRVLKNDKRAIFRASSLAAAAADYLAPPVAATVETVEPEETAEAA
jgi:antirestriction protein ArdC